MRTRGRWSDLTCGATRSRSTVQSSCQMAILVSHALYGSFLHRVPCFSQCLKHQTNDLDVVIRLVQNSLVWAGIQWNMHAFPKCPVGLAIEVHLVAFFVFDGRPHTLKLVDTSSARVETFARQNWSDCKHEGGCSKKDRREFGGISTCSIHPDMAQYSKATKIAFFRFPGCAEYSFGSLNMTSPDPSSTRRSRIPCG